MILVYYPWRGGEGPTGVLRRVEAHPSGSSSLAGAASDTARTPRRGSFNLALDGSSAALRGHWGDGAALTAKRLVGE